VAATTAKKAPTKANHTRTRYASVMPYVKAEYRTALDPAIRELSRSIVEVARTMPEETAFAGLLNYACTSVAMQVIEGRFGRIRYGTIATVTGVFKNIADEFYRRVAAPYEDDQIAANGDVPLYAQHARPARGQR
jgi:hypothetical protein